ncbi:MAG: VWA domain-containing protein, partial [Thermoleophilia bacterium]|nr:VWA domain-containing protein [Thermoleophilia bacterium]
ETARRIAARLAIPLPARADLGRRGGGAPRSAPYREGLDEIDLDATLEVLAEQPRPADADIVMRDTPRPRRSIVLAVDVSGSMRGERLRTAAATVGALSGTLNDDRLAVLAFWSDAAWVAHLDSELSPRRTIDALLGIPARGLTNVSFPLELAARELAEVREGARVVLLSDCVHNAGPDQRRIASSLPRLDVLLDRGGETDVELGRDLARLGGGRLLPIDGHRDVVPALRRALGP